MSSTKVDLMCEILEDGIRNNDVSPLYKQRVLEALNPLQLKTFMLSMAMQLEKDNRVKVVKVRGPNK